MSPDGLRAQSFDEVEVHLAALWSELIALREQVRRHEDELDTFVRTVWWRRWLFILDGWSGHRVVDAPRWRPWRSWWRS